MSTQEQQNILVDVKTEYIPDQSDKNQQRFVFAYHVTISNEGNQPAQLISRHWIITDGNKQVQEVRGEGVIGKQPTIKPGENFEYTSGAVLETPVGSMHGSYEMVGANGEMFHTKIPVFTLASPNALN
ncbi:MAG: Co2+/Mg2+ efflux protein ApaG [Gammaproteobacteria bacterium]|nr:MAG: Co2+/Mg2+ efflux protein ApaG [Gammaproteobacteria bacterium]